ncbi:MAG: NADP-specific glutamate dehydrogenase [Oligoflexia bacterium]|nr:NADP-specific glutamate dehydrogenase [Oligoflexia bacterium]
MNTYAQTVLSNLEKKYYWEKEFIQAVKEVFEAISYVLDKRPDYKNGRILERIVEPERIISFRVPWEDDRGDYQVNTGYRVEFNSALGPYKGGLRFHSSVTLSILKFLGFEQIFKNALTGLSLGGGKGGSDFSTRGKSENEIMRFCQSFMNELFRHIGDNTDVPAGDIGVGAREIGYLFGQYKRLANKFTGVLTGKGTCWGGSLLRPEATGFGVVYFLEEMLKSKADSIKGKRIVISGFGNVAWGVAKKAYELGGRIVTLSGPDGFIHDKDGVSGEKIDYMLDLRLSCNDRVEDYAKKFKVDFFSNKKPWEVPCDIAIPCATQNEIGTADVKKLIRNKCKYIVEGSNLPVALDAVKVLQKSKILYAPGKASNAGGVAVSGLEMSQNSMRLCWITGDIDKKLRSIMKNIHDTCLNVSHEYGRPHDYVFGANVSGFLKVADAMMDQGLA